MTDQIPENVVQLLRDFAEGSDQCWLDHHGGCQEHGYISLEPGQLCPFEEAKQILRKHDAETSYNHHIIFDGPPENVGGRFIEVEDDFGKSVSVGEWKDRGDGTWELVIPHG